MAGLLSRRRAALLGLAVAVTAVHLWLADGTLESRLGAGAADARPQRFEIAFVRTLEQAAPPPAAPAPPPRRPRTVAAAAPAASAPASEPAPPAEPVPEPVPPPAEEPPPVPEPVLAEAGLPTPEPLASAPAAAASAPEPAQVAEAAAAAASPASAPTAFDWPPSTRLSYTLTGNFRGPVEGRARVEWLRSGTRYQVHLDASVGPDFAPLVSRRLSSDGEITDAGLAPRRYDEETKVAFRDPRRLTMRFDAEHVQLANGRQVPSPPGVQDSASQFVQMTWLFTLQPALLTPGRSIDIALALPRRVETWTYDVLARETLVTPVGYVETVHVKPRREPRAGGDLTAEMWVAPSLQYLPVRIVIRQDAETHIDLLIDTLPLQAQPPAPGR